MLNFNDFSNSIVIDKNVQLQDHITEDPLNKHRISSNESALVSEFLSAIDNENIIVAPGQEKTPVSIVNDNYCEKLDFPYLIPNGKSGYNAEREVAISPLSYFNQQLLSFNQSFASDSNNSFFTRSIYEQYHLCSSINFVIQKIKPG